MSRLERLCSIFENVDEEKSIVVRPLLDEVVFLEEKLQELKELPHIRIHPTNRSRQEATIAGRMYKETLQQYNNCIRVLLSTLGKYTQEGEDEFEKWLKENS